MHPPGDNLGAILRPNGAHLATLRHSLALPLRVNKSEPSCHTNRQVFTLQVVVTVCGMTKTTGYIRLGPHLPDIILVKQEMDYELTGEQVTGSPELMK